MLDEGHREQPILIVGGTGRAGRRVAERLQAEGLKARPASRKGNTRFDWEDSSTWAEALEGASAAYVTVSPEVALPRSAGLVGDFAATAVEKDVKRLVLLSARGEEGAVASEDALKESGAEWTVLRSSHFMQNFSEGIFRPAINAGELALPAGETPEPFIDLDDIADVAAAVLTRPGHERATYELTGPQALTYAEAIAEIARGTGRDVRYRRIPAEAFASGLGSQGVPKDLRDLLVEIFATVLDGRNATPTSDVRQILGREPIGFGDFARRASAAGVWDV